MRDRGFNENDRPLYPTHRLPPKIEAEDEGQLTNSEMIGIALIAGVVVCLGISGIYVLGWLTIRAWAVHPIVGLVMTGVCFGVAALTWASIMVLKEDS